LDDIPGASKDYSTETMLSYFAKAGCADPPLGVPNREPPKTTALKHSFQILKNLAAQTVCAVRNIVVPLLASRGTLSSFFQKQSPTWRGIRVIPFCEGATTRRQAFLTFLLLGLLILALRAQTS
jgi:hypothetical protein